MSKETMEQEIARLKTLLGEAGRNYYTGSPVSDELIQWWGVHRVIDQRNPEDPT